MLTKDNGRRAEAVRPLLLIHEATDVTGMATFINLMSEMTIYHELLPIFCPVD